MKPQAFFHNSLAVASTEKISRGNRADCVSRRKTERERERERVQDLAHGGNHVEPHEFPHDDPPVPLVRPLQERCDFLDDAHLSVFIHSFSFFLSFFLFIAGTVAGRT